MQGLEDNDGSASSLSRVTYIYLSFSGLFPSDP